MKLGDEVMLESLFEGAYYQADFQISDIRDFSETENLIILNLKSNFRIKTKRSMERHYVSIPILIEDKYNGVIWDFNEMFLGIVTLNEYIYEIQKNVSVKLSIPDFNITFHGTIIKIRQEFFNLSKFIFEIKIMQDPTGLFGQYLNQIIGENVFHNKEIEEEENSGGAEQ
ncbi:hypothetical protein [Marinitoga sp. 1138]|nr:hypothetical protein [Marinitoga sp. 1138]